MRKLIENIVTPLMPEGLAKFVPNCSVCPNKIPVRRLTGSGRDYKRLTCCQECERIYRLARGYRTQQTVCIKCRKPTTPQEAEEFIAWRKHRGDIRDKGGRPAGTFGVKRGAALEAALKEASSMLTQWVDENSAGEYSTSQITEAIERFQILIDGPAANKSTLRESGEAATSEEESHGTVGGSAFRASSGIGDEHSIGPDGPQYDRAGGGTAAGDSDSNQQHRDAGADAGTGERGAELCDSAGHGNRADTV